MAKTKSKPGVPEVFSETEFIDIDEYDGIAYKDLINALAAGEADIADGKIIGIDESYARHRKKYGY